MHYFKDLRLVIQIPLPLIQNRSSFEREEELLPQIQKYVATALYKTLVYKRLTDENFYLNPLPRDFETNPNPNYDQNLYTDGTPYLYMEDHRDKHLFDLARQIGGESAFDLDAQELLTAKRWFDGDDSDVRQRAFIAFLVQIEVDTPKGRNSILKRRINTQRFVDPDRAKNLARQSKVNYEDATRIDDPFISQRSSMAAGLQEVYESKPADNIIKEDQWNDSQRAFMKLALRFGRLVGFDHIYLVESTAPFAGLFARSGSSMDMYFNNSLTQNIGKIGSGKGDEVHRPTNTISHELAHFLEEMERCQLDGRSMTGDFRILTAADDQDFTHDQRFIDLMRLMAVFVLASDQPDQAMKTPAMTKFKKASGPGGIDLTPARLKVETQNDGETIQFHINPQMLERLKNTSGFAPVIINIQPMKNLRAFLGITS